MSAQQPLYSLHERIWHWLQSVAIILLIFSGLAIHYSGRLGRSLSLATAVDWHIWIGFALLVNGFLGIFYHITAEKYHHFLPHVEDFTGAAVRQARFYLYGIFKGEKHPMDTDSRRKLNSLQKLTYLALLNVLLPFQIATGVLLWGADRWPNLFSKLGGFWVIAPAHTLAAFALLAFLFGHLYLATTGETPVSLVRSMITGYHGQPEASASNAD